MAERYVPPHLRKKNEEETNSVDGVPSPLIASKRKDNTLSRVEIHDYFWPVSEEIKADNQAGTTRVRLNKPLHSSAQTPDQAAFVLLRKGGNKSANRKYRFP